MLNLRVKTLQWWVMIMIGVTITSMCCSSSSFYRHQQKPPRALQDFPRSFHPSDPLSRRPQRRRRQQQQQSCNEVIDEWAQEEVSQAVSEFNAEISAFIDSVSVSTGSSVLQYGMQVRRVCASCSDLWNHTGGDLSSLSSLESFCGDDVYGAGDVMHSGLLFLPTIPTTSPTNSSSSSSLLLPGTFPTVIFNHGSSTYFVPSLQYVFPLPPHVLFGAAMSSFGFAVLLPDFLGYGESNGVVSKAYLIRRSYETSVVPLWYKTARMVSDETNCQSALADAIVLYGYSEGGYASVALAETFSQLLGIRVLDVGAGAAPLSPAISAATSQASIDRGDYPIEDRYILALFGHAYSSTYPGLANYDISNVLRPEKRTEIMDLLFGLEESEARPAVRDTVPATNLSSIFVDAYVTRIREANTDQGNLTNPCNQVLEPIFQVVCDAFAENDLRDVLLNKASTENCYPITFCHSPMDEVVGIENSPPMSLIDQMDEWTFVQAAGTHSQAAESCTLLALSRLLLRAPLYESMYAPKHSTTSSCPTPSPTVSPAVQQPSELPTQEPLGADETVALQPTPIPALVPTPRQSPSSTSAKGLHAALLVLSIFAFISAA